jgi:hypothetical protein
VWAVRWHKAGSFARLALCVGFVCLANVPDLVRWVVSAKSWMLKVCKMSFRVTYNVQGFVQVWDFEFRLLVNVSQIYRFKKLFELINIFHH